MAAGLKRDSVVFTRIAVTDCGQSKTQSRTLSIPNDENEDDMYPQYFGRTATSPIWEDSEFSKLRRCLVEFQKAPDAETVRTLSGWIAPWYAILEAGGFALPIGPPHETECISGPVSQFDEFTVEIVVERFFASERAWDVLANMLDKYSRTHSWLSRITIE